MMPPAAWDAATTPQKCGDGGGRILATWSCALGYCEALATPKDASRRCNVFPIPWAALQRLVDDDFVSLVREAKASWLAEGSATSGPTAAPATIAPGCDCGQNDESRKIPSGEKSLRSKKDGGTPRETTCTGASGGPRSASTKDNSAPRSTPITTTHREMEDRHRYQIRAMANAVWNRASAKPNVRDELHANSVYVALRGGIDKKSLDCFGAALSTVVGMYLWHGDVDQEGATEPNGTQGERPSHYFHSFLTLSEDHAYERHVLTEITSISSSSSNTEHPPKAVGGTCEVAIPGSTKLVKSKRGREIAAALEPNDGGDGCTSESPKEKRRTHLLKPETSWLYMADHPVICTSIAMALVAVVGNLNCTIEPGSGGGTSPTLASAQLYNLKRDLLWELYDQGHMAAFPFGLMELGDCEEHRGSRRGQEEVVIDLIRAVDQTDATSGPSSSIAVLRNELLFVEAIHINIVQYEEAQVYPYLYAGHYHKDAGRQVGRPDQEYRLVEAMRLYARAACVASTRYPYYAGCIQLNKHMTTVAMLIAQDMLMSPTASPSEDQETKSKPTKPSVRTWEYRSNVVAFGFWLLSFFDSLLYWEEASGDTANTQYFVEVLNCSHKYSMGRLWSLLPLDVRIEIVNNVGSTPPKSLTTETIPAPQPSPLIACTHQDSLSYSVHIRSKRLAPKGGGLLLTALKKTKIAIHEMALVIPTSVSMGGDEIDTTTIRRSKRPKW